MRVQSPPDSSPQEARHPLELHRILGTQLCQQTIHREGLSKEAAAGVNGRIRVLTLSGPTCAHPGSLA